MEGASEGGGRGEGGGGGGGGGSGSGGGIRLGMTPLPVSSPSEIPSLVENSINSEISVGNGGIYFTFVLSLR